MKSTLLHTMAVAAVMPLLMSSCNESKAQTPAAVTTSNAPSAGGQAEIFVDSGTSTGYSTNRNADARGTLQVANDRWVCVKDGSAETWIPRDRVVMIKLSR